MHAHARYSTVRRKRKRRGAVSEGGVVFLSVITPYGMRRGGVVVGMRAFGGQVRKKVMKIDRAAVGVIGWLLIFLLPLQLLSISPALSFCRLFFYRSALLFQLSFLSMYNTIPS